MTAKELKASILQLAVTGKLVPQDPNDEPASVLLERIKTEKAKLVKAGKIKKDKNPSEIVTGSDGAVYEKFKDGTVKDISDDIPFEIPEGWAWTRLEHCLVSLHTGLNPRRFFRLNTIDAKNYYVTIRELRNNKVIFTERTDRINDEALRLCNNRSDLDKGDVLFAGTGSIGIMALVEQKPTNWNIKEGVYALKPFQAALFPQYLLHILQSEAMRAIFMQKAVGSTIASVPMKSLLSLLLPLPPLAEQKRIVAKIEKLMPLVEEYGKTEETRRQLDADLPTSLAKSILQEAIQGKLVPQDPNDEPASELLRRVAAERKALVKAGKLKASKAESVIFRGSDRLAYETRDGETVCIQDEIPFDIPDSWEWVRLGDLIDTESGLSYRKEDLAIKDNSMVRILRGGNILDGEFVFKDDDVFIARKMLSGCPTIHRFDFVLPAVTSHIHLGKTALFRDDLNDTCAGGFLLMLHLSFKDIRLAEYLLLYFQSRTYKDYCKTIANKSGQTFFNLSRKKLLQTPIPIPPIAEQSRIVERMRIIKDQIISLTM